MTEHYFFPMFDRLTPKSEWRGGRITDTDLLTLAEAASMASTHAGSEVSQNDILRAAGRGEIRLCAIIHRTAKTEPCREGDTPLNNGKPAPEGAIPTLPLVACQALANVGRATWRTFDDFDRRDGMLCRYTRWQLAADEPDFVTLPDDCRITGYDLHALADAFVDAPIQEDASLGTETLMETYQRILGGDVFPPGVYPYTQASTEIARAHDWSDVREDALRHDMAAAINAGELLTFDRNTGLRNSEDEKQEFLMLVTVADVNAWLESRGANYRWVRPEQVPEMDDTIAINPAPTVPIPAERRLLNVEDVLEAIAQAKYGPCPAPDDENYNQHVEADKMTKRQAVRAAFRDDRLAARFKDGSKYTNPPASEFLDKVYVEREQFSRFAADEWMVALGSDCGAESDSADTGVITLDPSTSRISVEGAITLLIDAKPFPLIVRPDGYTLLEKATEDIYRKFLRACKKLNISPRNPHDPFAEYTGDEKQADLFEITVEEFARYAAAHDVVVKIADSEQAAQTGDDSEVSDMPDEAEPGKTGTVTMWTLNKPERLDTLAYLIYNVLKSAHTAGRAKPKAREVMVDIEAARPSDFIGIAEGDLKYLDSNGDTKTANVEAIRKRIDRLTGKKMDVKQTLAGR